ncbi:calcium-binding protein [Pseudoduganella lutea]|uniref:Calcium-binding protein n=1 Tax=Pseudoduganella lutea TaxID=321985 RepID=A0A4V0Z3G4_9BURK|nr:calcium-binding protein [Pseudoduganella lutea]QBE63353.1 calcium-binding protein [Pseudoduganella lutea]
MLTQYLGSLRYTGAGNFTGTGSANSNRLEGGAGNDTLAGRDGGDRLDGGDGDDRLSGENDDDGLDGGAGNDTLSGGEGGDNLRGGDGEDLLDGGTDIDYLNGGKGDDVYFVDQFSDRIVEDADGGVDEARMTFSQNGLYLLSGNVEHGTVVSGAATKLYGNELANRLKGAMNSDTLLGLHGDDTLDGGAGADQLEGGEGNDVYIVDTIGDRIVEAEAGGDDKVVTTLAAFKLGANIEYLAYTGTGRFSGTGNDLANVIAGGSGNDTIDGAGGADTFVASGASGDYTWQRPNATDVMLVKGTQKITLKNIEHVRFSDVLLTLADMLGDLASADNDILAGTSGNDTLDGLAGADEMSGGAGDDLYVVDQTGDTVREKAGEGRDTVHVALTKGAYVLAANVEDAKVTSTGATGITGNDLDNALAGNAAVNVLTGGAGNDVLDGDKGNDVLAGGLGNDMYVVDATGDKVTELADQGTDTVSTRLAKYTAGANIENVTYTGTTAFAGTGNALDNVIAAGFGNDTIDGAAGKDRYVIEGDFADFQRQSPNDKDLVLVKGTQKITLRNIEEVEFSDGVKTLAQLQVNVASQGNDTLTGSDAADQMNGLAGADQLTGGKGDDTYFLDNAGDTVIELANGGIDTVSIGISAKMTYTLGGEIEHAKITSGAAIHLVGNGKDNTLTGNGAANMLTGGAGDDRLFGDKGNDTLDGGAGNDFYSVDAAGDKVLEAVDGGYDIVETTVAKTTLAANVEELRFTGKGAFTGIGNVLDNVIAGSTSSDKLTGGLGADTFVMGAGNDTITDFVRGTDHLAIARKIGDGDLVIEQVATPGVTGGFSSKAELVLFTQNVTSLSTTSAAKAIGSASEAYGLGETALFALHTASTTAVYLFTSSGNDAVVSNGELQQIATLTGVATIDAGDFGLSAFA